MKSELKFRNGRKPRDQWVKFPRVRMDWTSVAKYQEGIHVLNAVMLDKKSRTITGYIDTCLEFRHLPPETKKRLHKELMKSRKGRSMNSITKQSREELRTKLREILCNIT